MLACFMNFLQLVLSFVSGAKWGGLLRMNIADDLGCVVTHDMVHFSDSVLVAHARRYSPTVVRDCRCSFNVR